MNSYFTFLICSALTCLLLFTCSALTAESDATSLEEIRKLEKVQHLHEACQIASYSAYPMSTIRGIYVEVNISCENEDKKRFEIFENTIRTNLIEKFKRQGINAHCDNALRMFHSMCLESYIGYLVVNLELLPNGAVQYTSEGQCIVPIYI